MHVLRGPDTDAAVTFLRHEIAALKAARGRLVQAFGACRVDYVGRATSTLDQGERLILLKPDGTLLVHTAEKAKPVNWMPPGDTEFAVGVEDGHVTLTATRRKPHEVVRIAFESIGLLLALPVADARELVLRRTEGELHELFFEHPEIIEAGLVFQRGEKATRRGPLDLWGTDRDGRRVIVEVKRSKAGIAEATQLWRYVDEHRTRDGGKPVRGILVAPGVSAGAVRLLRDHGLEHLVIVWDDLLDRIDRPRAPGQATLGRFAAASAEAPAAPRPTVRTGRKRSR